MVEDYRPLARSLEWKLADLDCLVEALGKIPDLMRRCDPRRRPLAVGPGLRRIRKLRPQDVVELQ
jgi:hypothetical protein